MPYSRRARDVRGSKGGNSSQRFLSRASAASWRVQVLETVLPIDVHHDCAGVADDGQQSLDDDIRAAEHGAHGAHG